jgi:GTP pyrophosphokinase
MALAATASELGMADADELFEKVGLGERLAPLIAHRLGSSATAATGAEGDEHAAGAPPAPLAIAGTEGMLVTYGRCCYPVPGDPIMAFLTVGRGITVHREECANVEDYRRHPEKWLSVTWAPDGARQFVSGLRLEVANRVGVLAAVAAAIAGTNTNIDNVELHERDSETSELMFEVRVRDRRHLAQVMRVVRRMPDVLRLSRTLATRSRDE